MNILKLAYKNIIHNPLNLILSIILFGLGIGLINFLFLFNSQLKTKFDSNLAEIDLVIGAKGSPLQMILSSMYHIDNPTGNIKIGEAKAFLNPKHPLIKAAVPLSLGDSYKSYRIVGSTDSLMSFYGAELESGKVYAKDFEVTIGRAVADDTGLKIGDKFTSSHGFNDDKDLAHEDAAFKVVGILKGAGNVIDQLIITNPSTVWNVHDHETEVKVIEEEDSHDGHDHDEDNEEHDHAAHQNSSAPFARTNSELLQYPDKEITSILIKYKSRTNFQSLSMPRAINENTDMQAASPAIEINRLYSMIGIGREMIKWLAFLIAFISAVSIFIVLYKSMRERKYELALIRVMGGSRSDLFQLITLEGMIMTGIGFLVGFILSHLGMEIIANSLQSSYKYSFSGFYFMQFEVILFIISLLIGIIASLIPAIKAARTDIHSTLTERG